MSLFMWSYTLKKILSTLLCFLHLFSISFAQLPNDNIDDSVFVQKRLTELSKPSTVDRSPFAAGKYIITETLTIGPTMGLKISGSGGQNRSGSPGWDPFRTTTIFEWRGEVGKPIMVADGCTGLVIEGIGFESKDLNKRASIGLLISHGRTGALNIALRDCGFQNLGIGIQCGTDEGESTCANITYDNCHFEQCSVACVRIVNEQSLEHLFLRPQFAWSPKAIDVRKGGDITIVGGGSYEIGSILHLGQIGGNARGFDVHSLRPDGKNQRTAFLTVDDTDTPKGYGTITFSNMSQNDGQKGNISKPLVTVPPGASVILRDCSFNGSLENWAKVYSKTIGSVKVQGQLSVQDCDGISSTQFKTLVETKGPNSYYEFIRSGSIWGPRGTYSTFPDSQITSNITHTHDDLANAITTIVDLFNPVKENPILTLDEQKLRKLQELDLERLERAIRITNEVAEIE